MAVDQNVVEYVTSSVTAGVPIEVDIKLFDPAAVVVTYGNSRVLAAPGTHYTVVIGTGPSYRPFTVTPTIALVDAMNTLVASTLEELYQLQICRTLPLITTFNNTDAQFRERITDEFDRNLMIDQQLEEWLGRTVYQQPGKDYDAHGNNIINVADPIESQDAATKAYVDDVIAGAQIPAALLADFRVVNVSTDQFVVAADNKKIYAVDNTGDDITITLDAAVALGDRFVIGVSNRGTNDLFSTYAAVSIGTDRINDGTSMIVPRNKLIFFASDGVNTFIADDPSAFSETVIIGDLTAPVRYTEINSNGQFIRRYDDNANAAIFLLDNYAIGAVGQGLKLTWRYGNAGVLGADGATFEVKSTDTWALATNRSTEIVLRNRKANVGQDVIYVRDTGAITFPLQSRFSAHKTVTTADATGDGTVADVVGFNTTEDYDVGASFNPTTGVHTATITAMKTFTGGVLIGGLVAGHTSHRLTLAVSDPPRTIVLSQGAAFAIADGAGQLLLPFSRQVLVNAAGTVKLQLMVSGGTKVVDVIGDATVGVRVTQFTGAISA